MKLVKSKKFILEQKLNLHLFVEGVCGKEMLYLVLYSFGDTTLNFVMTLILNNFIFAKMTVHLLIIIDNIIKYIKIIF
jgi:hypothetical protein